jgi:hypothetical protein
LQGLEIGDGAAELLAFLHVGMGRIQCSLGRAHRAGGDIDAAAVQALHGDLEAFALAAQQVVRRNAHIVEADDARGLAVPAHLLFLLAIAHAGRIGRHGKGRDA